MNSSFEESAEGSSCHEVLTQRAELEKAREALARTRADLAVARQAVRSAMTRVVCSTFLKNNLLEEMGPALEEMESLQGSLSACESAFKLARECALEARSMVRIAKDRVADTETELLEVQAKLTQEPWQIYALAMYRAREQACFVVYGIMQRRDLSEEVVDSVILKLIEKFIGGYEVRSNVVNLFIKSSVNAALNYIRDNQNLVPYFEGESTISSDSFPQPDKVEFKGFKEILSCTTPDRALILDLMYSGGHSISEVAEILSLNEGTVKSRLHRGLDDIRVGLFRCSE